MLILCSVFWKIYNSIMLELFHSIFLCLFQVYSGYRFVLRASEMKKPISLLGIGPTRADKLANLKIDAKCSDVFNQVNIWWFYFILVFIYILCGFNKMICIFISFSCTKHYLFLIFILSPEMVSSPYEWKILECDRTPPTTPEKKLLWKYYRYI